MLMPKVVAELQREYQMSNPKAACAALCVSHASLRQLLLTHAIVGFVNVAWGTAYRAAMSFTNVNMNT